MVRLGDDERMTTVDRMNIEERKSMLVLINLLRRDFAGDDLAKEAIGVGHMTVV